MLLRAARDVNHAARLTARGIVRPMEAMAPCKLCGDPIDAGQAWMGNEVNGMVAHSGCVYRDEQQPELRERWQPSELLDLPGVPDRTRVSDER